MKKELTNNEKLDIIAERLANGVMFEKELMSKGITRAEFESLSSDEFRKTYGSLKIKDLRELYSSLV